MRGFVVPSSVHAAEDGNGDLVLLNQATGRWHKLNHTGADVYRALRSVADLDHAVALLVSRHPDVPAERIRQDVEHLVATLVERGLLVLADDVRRGASAVMMTSREPISTVGVRHRAAASVAFVMAIVLLRLPFRMTTSVVSRFRRALARKDASADEALSALAAAYRVSRSYPGRVACLETSLTAVLAGALRGRRIDWCFGTAVDPQTFHAWIEVAGEPVTDPFEDPIPPTYRRVLLV